MEADRSKYLADYIAYLMSGHVPTITIGVRIKECTHFLEHAESVDRRGYLRYKERYASEIEFLKYKPDGVLEMLALIGRGFRKAKKRRKLASLTLLSDISERNVLLMNGFISSLRKEDLSGGTVQSYNYEMKMFFKYCNEFNQENCKRFLTTLEDKGYKPSSINHYIGTLTKFSQWIKKPVKLKRARVARILNLENVPTKREYDKLIAYLKEKNPRLYWVVRILASTGMRASEMVQTTWADVLSGEVTLKCKGNKYRVIRFSKKLREDIKEFAGSHDISEHVCSGRYGVWTTRCLAVTLKDYGVKSGVPRDKLHPHAFRHFFAKQYIKKDKDPTHLAEILGHARLDTTMIYLRRSKAEQDREFNKYVDW